MRVKYLLLVIVILAAILRLVGLSSRPVGFTQDEASFGYDAYSILLTGKDQWGVTFPLALRSFGDYKLPLYSYLAIPSVAIFGLNEFATRLPSAVIGILAIVAVYLLARRLTKKESVALMSALLLTVSPWHISLSRGAFEANLTSFFLPLGIWAWLVSIEKPKYSWVWGLILGLNLFSYHSARILTLVLVATLLGLEFIKTKKITAKVGMVVFSGFFALILSTYLLGAGSRIQDVSILNPTDHWAGMANQRYQAIVSGMPAYVARVFSNKFVFVTREFIGSYLSYLSPTFLFVQGAGEWTYGMVPGWGVMYLVEICFLLFALLKLAQGKSFEKAGILILWIFLSPIPAALSKGPGFAANRVAVMMPAIQIISAFGAVGLYEELRKSWPESRYKLVGASVVIFLTLVLFFLEAYVFLAPWGGAKPMHYGVKQIMEVVQTHEPEYDKVILSRSLSVPQIWVGFYLKVDPKVYQLASDDWLRYENEGLPFVDQLGDYSLGKYQFTGIDINKLKGSSGILLVGRPEEFASGVHVLESVNYPDQTPAYLLVDSKAL